MCLALFIYNLSFLLDIGIYLPAARKIRKRQKWQTTGERVAHTYSISMPTFCTMLNEVFDSEEQHRLFLYCSYDPAYTTSTCLYWASNLCVLYSVRTCTRINDCCVLSSMCYTYTRKYIHIREHTNARAHTRCTVRNPTEAAAHWTKCLFRICFDQFASIDRTER